jgi:hypothetical protein
VKLFFNPGHHTGGTLALTKANEVCYSKRSWTYLQYLLHEAFKYSDGEKFSGYVETNAEPSYV